MLDALIDGLAYLIGLLCQIDVQGDPTLLAQCLADYTNPPVQVDGDLVYFAPWRVPSSNYLTAHGNTERHWLMAKSVVDYFWDHSGAGTIGCGCSKCKAVSDIEGFGERLSEMELELLGYIV